MRYAARPGIICTKICNTQLLVLTRKASETCPHIMRLNLLSAILWETIEKDKPMEQAFRAFQILLKKPDDEIEERMEQILEQFLRNGFIIAQETEE